jgi:hemoglobin
MGGPQLFIQEFGHPMLRRRHMNFAISASERDQWLLCMNKALQEIVEDEALRKELATALAGVADHMRNQPG